MNYIRPHVHKQMNTWIVHEYLLYKNRTSNWEGDGCCWLLPLVFDCRCCKIVVVEFVACIVKMLLLRSKIHHSYSDHFQIGLLQVFNKLFLFNLDCKGQRFTDRCLEGRSQNWFRDFRIFEKFSGHRVCYENNDLTRNEKKLELWVETILNVNWIMNETSSDKNGFVNEVRLEADPLWTQKLRTRIIVRSRREVLKMKTRFEGQILR